MFDFSLCRMNSTGQIQNISTRNDSMMKIAKRYDLALIYHLVRSNAVNSMQFKWKIWKISYFFVFTFTFTGIGQRKCMHQVKWRAVGREHYLISCLFEFLFQVSHLDSLWWWQKHISTICCAISVLKHVKKRNIPLNLKPIQSTCIQLVDAGFDLNQDIRGIRQ